MSVIEKWGLSSSAQTVIIISIMLIVGFLVTRITKKLKLPNVTAYIIAGILIGPYVLNLVPTSFVSGSSFLADVALAIISFGTGQILKLSDFKETGLKVLLLEFVEALVTFVLIFCLMFFIIKINNVSFCILMASIGVVTSNTSTMMIIRQTGAKGNFVNNLLLVIAFDNILALIAYSISIELVKTTQSNEAIDILVILKSLGLNLGVTVIGGVFGLLLKWLMPQRRTEDNRLIIVIAVLFAFCGICTSLGQSPLLGCMAMGIVYMNLAKEDKLFKQLNYFSPPLLLLFFVRSGVNVNLGSLVSGSGIGSVPLIVISIAYVAVRFIGKFGGIFLGGVITKSDKNVRNYLGLGLIPQGGVTLGLCTLAAREIGGDLGSSFETIIIASSVIYEFIGPALTNVALHLSKSYSDKIEDLTNVQSVDALGNKKTEVEILIERINEIKKNIPEHEVINEDEQAFDEAINEQYIETRRSGLIHRRR